jgi:hypothetical protein
METININGKNFSIEELNRLIAQSKSPMQKVWDYHGISEEAFNDMYKGLPVHIKAYAKECLVVDFYNKGWKPDWNDSKQKKYYLWLEYKNGAPTFNDGHHYYSYSSVPSRLYLKSKEDVLDMKDNFMDVIIESRKFN